MTSPTQLVTLGDVLGHLNVTAADVDIAKLQGFIDAATVYIQNFTGPVIAQSYTETYDGGRPFIQLLHPPILSVQSVVEYVGVTGYTLTQVSLGDPDIGAYSFSIENARGGLLRRRWNGGIAGDFTAGSSNVVVQYTAGQGAVTADIRMAVLQDIAGLFQPSQLGTNPYGSTTDAGNAPLNPIGMFPRVAEILSAPAMRTPSLA